MVATITTPPLNKIRNSKLLPNEQHEHIYNYFFESDSENFINNSNIFIRSAIIDIKNIACEKNTGEDMIISLNIDYLYIDNDTKNIN